MQTSLHASSATHCPDCGTTIPGGRSGCQKLFDEVLAREFGNYRYAKNHRLTVEAYALQHPAEYMKSAKSYAAHLTGMYAALELESATELNRLVQRWLNGSIDLERPAAPPQRCRGALTVAHVHEAVDPEDHARRVREWAQSAWESWRDYHQVARRWLEVATARRQR